MLGGARWSGPGKAPVLLAITAAAAAVALIECVWQAKHPTVVAA